MPAFTVERLRHIQSETHEEDPGNPIVVSARPVFYATHYASHMEATFEVCESGVLLLCMGGECEYIAPGSWVRVYDGPPRLDYE